MPSFLVDSNVLLDISTQDDRWYGWSSRALEKAADEGELGINPIIYAEVSVRYETIEELERVLDSVSFKRWALPWEAGFLAGKAFRRYRGAGGLKTSPMPDFYVGAHALINGLVLLTRDPKRYASYFPALELRAP